MTWIVLSLLFGIVYMRLIVGELPNEEEYFGFGFFLNLFYKIGSLYVGLIIGGIIAIIFIITDVFFLRKKTYFNYNSFLIKIHVLLVITILFGIFHYILEKMIDVI